MVRVRRGPIRPAASAEDPAASEAAARAAVLAEDDRAVSAAEDPAVLVVPVDLAEEVPAVEVQADDEYVVFI